MYLEDTTGRDLACGWEMGVLHGIILFISRL